MDTKDTALLAKLRGLFALEAQEHLQAITSGLLAIEKGPVGSEEHALLERLYREVHTLKGAARAVNHGEIEAICQVVEGVCGPLKRGELRLWPGFFDVVHRAMDTVRQLSEAPEGPAVGQVPRVMTELEGLEAHGRAHMRVTPLTANSAIAQSVPAAKDVAVETALSAQFAAPESEEVPRPMTMKKRERHRVTTSSEEPKLRRARTAKKQPAVAETVAASPVAITFVPEGPALAQMSGMIEELEGLDARGRTLMHSSPSVVETTPSVKAQLVAEKEKALTTVEVQTPMPAVVSTPLVPSQQPSLVASPLVSTAPVEQLVSVPTSMLPKGAPLRRKPQLAKKPTAQAETVRIATTKLDSLFVQAEEMLVVKLKTGEHAAELRTLAGSLDAWKREWARVHTDIRRAQRLIEKEENRNSADPIYGQAAKLVEFLDWTNDHLKGVDKALSGLTRAVTQDHQSLGSMVDGLLEDAKQVLMLPFGSILEVFPKMVRDLSRSQGKDVDLVLQGGEVEIDKRILEEMKDPLIHLLRNCLDHGIETPATREQQHKPSRGTISVAIVPGEGNEVELVVTDDGEGVDADKVKVAAVKCGILTQKAVEGLSEQEAISLIFQSDVSTSAVVSDISGRGLGMAIVREKVEKLGGQIAVETQRHRGTTFRIRLPLTLATFRGILIQTAGQVFVVPTANVERVVRVKAEEVRTVGEQETISLAGHTIPLMRLDQVLGYSGRPSSSAPSRYLPVLILGSAEKCMAFNVDAILNEQEVLFKTLGSQLAHVPTVAGATVLGSGQVAPVLSVADLLVSAGGKGVAVVKTTATAAPEEVRKKSLLVAEDSITSRMLLKEILEAAGYTVSTAIDGADAFANLEKGVFDLVVSDVEMPRMNGFDLTNKIRSDARYTNLPVILVTGLESQADRERGVDAGANAYVVKGSFDQSNLLETIRRLI